MAHPRTRTVAFLLAAATLLQAQGTTDIQVKDSSGIPIPHARVEVTGRSLATPFQGTTDGAGRCRCELPSDSYRLRISHPAYFTLSRPLQVKGSAALTLTLHPYGATVEVSERATVANLSLLDEPLNYLVGLADSANEGIVTPAELQSRAYQRPGDLLETVPGLLISQHSGEGKANQYYLRGFNLDHGTDVAMRVAGMPVNLPTNAHGQGYLDLNFMIPELVSRVQYRKGPTFAEEGDFSSAGSVDIGYVHALERPLVSLEAGSYDYRRLLLAGSWKVGGGDLLLAQEGVQNNGPWDTPEHFRKFSTVARWSRAEGTLRYGFTAMAYGATWNATDQIPQRAVDAGQVGYYGTLDPSDGGQSHRLSLSCEVQNQQGDFRDRLDAYWIGYRLELNSNFTGWMEDPIRGDQFQQAERRIYGGFNASRAWAFQFLGKPAEIEGGLQARWDNLPSVGLHHTVQRQRISTTREDHVLESSWAPFLQLKLQPAEKIRATLGLRHDHYAFDVASRWAENSGHIQASITSPKASIAFGPWSETEFYIAGGRSFHSNDARGTTLHVDPKTGSRIDGKGNTIAPVTPLVRSTGYEIGVRSAALPRWQWTFSLWRLDLGSELVFSGDAGITEPSRPSRREGAELSNTVQLAPWASVDMDLAYSRARFTVFDAVGDHIPGAVEGVGSLSLNLHPAKAWEITVGLRYFGARPLVEDNSVRSRPSTLAQGKVSWEASPRWKFTLEGFNLANRRASDIDYFYESQLKTESAPVSDIHFHPVEPRNFRFGVTWHF